MHGEGRNRNSDQGSGMGFGMSFDQAKSMLRNAEAKERGKLEFKAKWPTDELRELISSCARGQVPFVIDSDGTTYSIKYCTHDVANTNPPGSRCVFVQAVKGVVPCGHFIY